MNTLDMPQLKVCLMLVIGRLWICSCKSQNLVSLASSNPLMSLFRWASVSVSAAVARLASSRPITLTLLGVMEEYN